MGPMKTDVSEQIKGTQHESEELAPDITCGIGNFRPKWLQIFASKKSFVVIYSLIGMLQYVIGRYYVGTLSTVEKSYNMSSKTSGILTGVWDLGTILANLTITYVAAKGHRTRWISVGIFLAGVSCFIRITPYLLFGPGKDVGKYTEEYGYSIINALGNTSNTSIRIETSRMNENCVSGDEFVDNFAFWAFCLSNLILGMGISVYWTCGMAYLDDNVRKNILPAMLAVVQSLRILGPTFGSLAASYALKIYVEPTLTPYITSKDPRWKGAWWIGWSPIGIACCVCASLLFLFPRELPRAAIRKRNVPKESKTISWTDFTNSLRRILKNKLLMLNTLSSTCFSVGIVAYWIFMPKYIESQFRLSPSQTTFLIGIVGVVSNMLGIFISGITITKLKPSPRLLAGWNVFVEFLDSLGHISFSWLSCATQPFHGTWNDGQHSWNLTQSCNRAYNCGTDIKYAPVCDLNSGLAFYSSCHAGCESFSRINNTSIYNNCSCVTDFGPVVDGLCPSDCSKTVIIFFLIYAILNFNWATGRTANTLIQFRCVKKDTSLSFGVADSLSLVLAYMPTSIFSGIIIDWACIVWSDNCGSPGNCWIYDNDRLHVFNIIASGFLLLGAILDCFVWYYAKGLKVYDEDYQNPDEFQDPQQIPIVDEENTHPLISISNDVENK